MNWIAFYALCVLGPVALAVESERHYFRRVVDLIVGAITTAPFVRRYVSK